MATKVTSTYKLKAKERKALLAYLKGELGLRAAAQVFNVTPHRFYTIVATVMRHAGSTGKFDPGAVVGHY